MGYVRMLVMSFLWKGVLGANGDRDAYFTVTLPDPVKAQEGLCVLIPCQFTYEETEEAAVTSRGYWFIEGDIKDDPAVASNDRNKEIREDTRGRFRLVGDVNQRDCSLRIDDVRRSDEINYYFRYEHNEHPTTKYSLIHYPLRVMVVGLQDAPEISLPDRVIEGETVTVECTAPGRCSGTAPEITWGPEPRFKYSQSFHNINNPDGTKIYKSTITFTASRQHNNKSLSCTAYFPAVETQTTKSISLTVDYPPDESDNFMDKINGVPGGVIIIIVVTTILVLVLLVGVSLCMTRKIRKRGNTGNRSMNKASNDTTADSTYQELQRRQSDTYSVLKRDGK